MKSLSGIQAIVLLMSAASFASASPKEVTETGSDQGHGQGYSAEVASEAAAQAKAVQDCGGGPVADLGTGGNYVRQYAYSQETDTTTYTGVFACESVYAEGGGTTVQNNPGRECGLAIQDAKAQALQACGSAYSSVAEFVDFGCQPIGGGNDGFDSSYSAYYLCVK